LFVSGTFKARDNCQSLKNSSRVYEWAAAAKITARMVRERDEKQA
jgi:hypothetical protein